MWPQVFTFAAVSQLTGRPYRTCMSLSEFPQVTHYKIPGLFQITLKYFQAFHGALYNRGSAIILRMRGTNITASKASRKILGVVPHI